jgi:hypothetical protein
MIRDEGLHDMMETFANLRVSFPTLKIKPADVLPSPQTIFANLGNVAAEVIHGVALFLSEFILRKDSGSYSTDMYSHPKT